MAEEWDCQRRSTIEAAKGYTETLKLAGDGCVGWNADSIWLRVEANCCSVGHCCLKGCLRREYVLLASVDGGINGKEYVECYRQYAGAMKHGFNPSAPELR